MYIKLPTYLFFYIELILNGFEVVKSTTRVIGRDWPWKSRLFWAQMAFASLVAIQGPKKSQCSWFDAFVVSTYGTGAFSEGTLIHTRR
jgi:hypothetical protein